MTRPPFPLKAELDVVLPALSRVLSEPTGGSCRVVEITGERPAEN